MQLSKITIKGFRAFDKEGASIKIKNRLYLSIPLFVIAFALTQIDFGIIWRYFAWSNQTLAMVGLWTITDFLIYEGKAYWISGIPALFMTMVCSTYILIAPEGFNLDNDVAYLGGALITTCITVLFWIYITKEKKVYSGV